MNCYLDFYRSDHKFTIARKTCLKYLTYPILEWRKLFIGVANQIAELDGDDMIEDADLDDESNKLKKAREAEQEPYLNFEINKT